jgi:cyclase
MIKKRVIPMVLDHGGRVVKGKSFDNWRTVGVLRASLLVFDGRDVDELIVIDERSSKGHAPFRREILREIAECCSVPVSVGGGISTFEEVAWLFENGADRVVLGVTSARSFHLIGEVAEAFGQQAVVASLNVGSVQMKEWQLLTSSGLPVEFDFADACKRAVDSGSGEILVNSIDADGHMKGLDAVLGATVSSWIDAPVILAGGAGRISDFVGVLSGTDVAAVAAGSIFQFTQITPLDIRRELEAAGMAVRKSIKS